MANGATKSVRVIAKGSDLPNTHRTVNILTTTVGATQDNQSIKTCLQVSGVPTPPSQIETVFAGATGTTASPPTGNGLPTISIAGYTSPS